MVPTQGAAGMYIHSQGLLWSLLAKGPAVGVWEQLFLTRETELEIWAVTVFSWPYLSSNTWIARPCPSSHSCWAPCLKPEQLNLARWSPMGPYSLHSYGETLPMKSLLFSVRMLRDVYEHMCIYTHIDLLWISISGLTWKFWCIKAIEINCMDFTKIRLL